MPSHGQLLASPDDIITVRRVVPRKMLAAIGQSNVHSATSRVPTGITMAQAITIAPSFANAFANVQEIRQCGVTPSDPPTWSTTGGGVQGPVSLAPRPTNTDEAAGGVFGPYLSAGHFLDHSQPLGWHVAYMGLGGSSLATNWKSPSGGYPTTGAKLADLALTFIANALATYGLTLADYGGTYWSQGTTDALTTALANAYAANFATFFDHMVLGLGGYVGGVPANGPVHPWFIEQLNSLSGGGADLTTVRNAKAAFVAATPNTYLISAENLPFYGSVLNETHYEADGNIIVGENLGDAVLAANAIPQVPRANFKWFGTALSLAFTDTSFLGPLGGSITSWAWSFGDGATSTSQNPTHAYAAAGAYTATLTVTTAAGKSDSISWSVIAVAAVGWAIDATALIACPANATESAALHAALLPSSSTSGPPTHIWPMQDNCQSSPFTQSDVGPTGGVALSANGTFTSRAVVAGWSRLGNTFTDNAAGARLSSTSASLPDASTTSTMIVGFWKMPAAAPSGGTARGIQVVGVTGNCDLRLSITTGKPRQVAANQIETNNNICDGGSHFIIIQDNATAGRCFVFTDLGWFALPRRAPAAGKSLGFAGFAANSPAASCVWGALYEGAAAEKTPTEVWRWAVGSGFPMQWSQPR